MRTMTEDARLSQLITNSDMRGIHKLLTGNVKVDMNYRDIVYSLQTPLMRLCHLKLTDSSEIVDLILKRPININTIDGQGKTVLSHACLHQNTALIEKLAQHGHCDANIEDDTGCTPLFYAVRCRNPAVVDSLLQCFLRTGLDVNHQDHKGMTALEEAKSNSDREICHLLRTSGALSGRPIPRNISQLRQGRLPTPPLLLKHRHNKQDLSPVVVSKRETLPSDKVNKSCESLQCNHLMTSDRENSMSLPDLRNSTGSSSCDSLLSQFSLNISSTSITDTHCIENRSGHPHHNTQHSDSDDDVFALSLDSATFSARKRKNSLSLPELRMDVKKGQTKSMVSNDMTPLSSHRSLITMSNDSLTSKHKQKTLTLPRIDTTPRVAYPHTDTTPRMANYPNIDATPRRANQSLINYTEKKQTGL